MEGETGRKVEKLWLKYKNKEINKQKEIKKLGRLLFPILLEVVCLLHGSRILATIPRQDMAGLSLALLTRPPWTSLGASGTERSVGSLGTDCVTKRRARSLSLFSD